MLTSAGPVVKLVLLLLLVFSITSWAIVFIKYRYIRSAHHASMAFLDLFWQCRSLADAFARARTQKASPGGPAFYGWLHGNQKVRPCRERWAFPGR